MSDVALQSTIENTKSSVRTAYWALRQAIERIEIQRLSLLLAQQVVADNKIKVEIGTMAPIDQTTAEVQEAQSEQALLNAQVQWTTAELVLKRLIVGGPDDELYTQHAQPDDQSGLRAAERRYCGGDSKRDGAAHGHRPAAPEPRRQQSQPRGDEGRDQAAARPDGQLPAGRHGRLVDRHQTGNYFDALLRARHAQHADVDGRLELQLPHRHGVPPARRTRAPRSSATRRSQGIKVTELQIATEVTNAGLAVQNSWLQFQAAQKSRQAAEKNAAAEQTRFDVGMSNPYNVATALNNLTNARLGELQAIVNYVNAVAEFDRVQRVGR